MYRKQCHLVLHQTIKYLRINVARELEDPYSENCRTLMKEIENKNKWKDTSCTWN